MTNDTHGQSMSERAATTQAESVKPRRAQRPRVPTHVTLTRRPRFGGGEHGVNMLRRRFSPRNSDPGNQDFMDLISAGLTMRSSRWKALLFVFALCSATVMGIEAA